MKGRKKMWGKRTASNIEEAEAALQMLAGRLDSLELQVSAHLKQDQEFKEGLRSLYHRLKQGMAAIDNNEKVK